MPASKPSPRFEGVDFRGWWRVIVRRRWVLYLAVLIAGLVSLIGSFLTTPLYKATTTLQIERQLPDILDMRGVARTDLWMTFDQFHQTQYRIISSRPVARLAAERLGLTAHREFAATGPPPGRLGALGRLLPSKRRVSVERDPLDVAADRLRARLEVVPLSYSYLVTLSWVHADPRFAAEVANAIADAYIQFSLQSLFSTTDQAREFLGGQIETLKQEIGAIEQRVQEYAEAKQILAADDSSNLTLQALKDIYERRTAAQTELARAEAVHRAAQQADAEELPEVMNSELLHQLRAEYAADEAEYSQRSRTFGDDWPGMQTLTSKLEQSRQRLALETERIARQVSGAAAADWRRARNEVEELDRLLGRHESAAQQQKRDVVEYANLQSEARKKRETLDALLRRQNEMALSTRLQEMDSTSSNIRVVERAQPPAVPFRPRTAVNLSVGLALGLSLGLALLFFLDYVDNTISSADELRELVPAPLLAVIPRHGGAESALSRVRRRPAVPVDSIDLITHRDGRARIAEAYRSLRTAILLSSPGRPPRRVVVTSALPEEGKTVTALNLGVALAQLGRRVILVETDLRRPRLHRALGATSRLGVSTFLSGLEKDLERLVQPTSIDNLSLLASGPLPPNPSELLNSPVFAELGRRLIEAGYDHVLFDSPPVLSVSDPLIVAAAADICIIVVRAGRSARQSIRAVVERLAQAAGGPLGVVLNDLDIDTPGAAFDRHEYDVRYSPAPAAHPASGADAAQQASGGA